MNTLINLIANIIITISVTFFIIGVFGNGNKSIERLNLFEKYLVKAGLSITACGSLFNSLTLSTPNNTEILLNVGLAFIFLWGAIFHWKYFVKVNK